MTHEKSPIGELISTLKQQRDELAVKIYLGAAEAKEEWENATDKLDELTQDYDPVKQAVSESAESVTESMKLVAEEVMNSFNRIRKSL
jgi:chromosome segregation ATPase